MLNKKKKNEKINDDLFGNDQFFLIAQKNLLQSKNGLTIILNTNEKITKFA